MRLNYLSRRPENTAISLNPLLLASDAAVNVVIFMARKNEIDTDEFNDSRFLATECDNVYSLINLQTRFISKEERT